MKFEDLEQVVDRFYEGLVALREAFDDLVKQVTDAWEKLSESILAAASVVPEAKTPVEFARSRCGRFDIHRGKPIERVYAVKRNLPYQRRRY